MGLEGTRLPTVRHWSITTRLTFLYGIYAFALLALASNIVYWSMLSNIQTVEWKFLTNKVFIFRTILAEHAADSGTLKQEVEWEKIPPHSGQYYAYYSRISDLSKKVILQTPGFDEALTNVVFPQPVRGDVDESSIERWKSVEGKSYLLISAWSKESKNRATDKTIDVALDVTQEDILVDQYERQMAVVLIIGLMLAVSLGYVVARRGMRPLTEIAQAAEHITASQLHERIDPERWPKELALLAGAFDRMLDRLEESFTRLSRFSADLAHEIRTPINNLMGEAEVTLSKPRTTEEYRQTLESSLEEFQRLSHMIKSLLFIARAEESTKVVKRTWLSVHKELESVRDFHSAVAEEKGISLRCECEARLWADQTLFRLAVSNLLANALQYTPSGGRIVVVVTQTAKGGVVINMSDSGCGIEPEDMKRVFDRFYRTRNARSDYPMGAGLGLAIVKSIMKMHGGKASVFSVPGHGTTFTLHFPPCSEGP